MQDASLLAMYNTYGSQPGTHPTYSVYSASGLESAVTSAYQTSQYSRFHGSESPMMYTGLAMHSNPYASAYSESSRTSSCKSVSSDWAEGSSAIYHSQPFAFLNPSRPGTPFVGDAAEIVGFIREAFAKTTSKELPENITITVAPRNVLQASHRLFLNQGIVGLSFNSSSVNPNRAEHDWAHSPDGKLREIFAVAGSLDEVMLVIGHELGHVLTPALGSQKAEEAKAFAFEMAWAHAIFEHDIARLRNSINAAAVNMKPAANGLHDLAFAFVKAATLAGKEPLQLHSQLSLQRDFDIDFESESQETAAAAPLSYVPLASSTPHRAGYHSGGYRNKSNVQNVPFFNNFTWTDLGTGIYGMYIPLTASIFMNDRLLRTDLEQFHKTLGHEYILHHVMQLPDNYVTKILEETIFWVKDEEDKYKP